MRSRSTNGWRLVVPVAFLVGAIAAPAMAYHWYHGGWRDRHYNYPPKPYGYSQIVNVFGQPCNANANANSFAWKAADNNVWYRVNFHRKLGGNASSNLNNDVRGHIGNAHLDWAVTHGIYGFVCRDTRNGSGTSTHAWGIAVDVSSAAEPYRQCHSRQNYHHAYIWRDHRWTWGKSWCDPMHFQYASGY